VLGKDEPTQKEITMKRNVGSLTRFWFAVAATLLLFARAALAGPPLICHTIDIGSAQSLPWTSTGWNLTGNEKYDTSHLVADTLALLNPGTPVLVRMETLRRATLYAQQKPVIQKELLVKLEGRTHDNPKDALAAFDFGYLAESYKQASWLHQHTDWLKASGAEAASNPAMNVDGYGWVKKAIELRGGDAEMEFAAALIASSSGGTQKERDAHLQRARAGERDNSLLARNLEARFPEKVARVRQ
jgi:hypothetical protein